MFKRINLVFCFLSCCALLFGQSPQALLEKAGDASKYPNDNLLVIYDSTRVDVQESGLSYVNNHKLIKVLTPEGAKGVCVVRCDYDPQSAFVEIRKVVVHKHSGEDKELDVRSVQDYPAPARAIYWGSREKMIGVGRLEPGDGLEIFTFRKGFTYALLGGDDDDRYIPPMKGHFYDIVPFYQNDPVLLKYYEVKVPRDKKLQYKFYNGNVVSAERDLGDKKLFTFTQTDILPVKKEQGMADLSDVAPKLLLSTSPDWNAKSAWFYKVNEDYGSFETNAEITAKVREILKGAGSEIDSVSRLTHWCADEIRYSGISMGQGEGFTLHKGSMDFTDRCGVCKDKAGMLITMLRAAGFKAFPAMTMAGSRIEEIPADQFNHCVVVAKLSDGKYHLLDPTWVPFIRELWSSAEQQQNYLMGVPETAGLAITPLSPPENHYFRIDGFSEVRQDGSLHGGFTLTAEGQSDAAVRRSFTGNFKALWKKSMETELLKVAPQARLTMLDLGDPYDLSKPITLRFQFEIPDYALVTKNEVIFTPLVASNIFKRMQGHLGFSTGLKERKYPFRDRCSRELNLNEIIRLPAATGVAYSPSADQVSGSGADFTAGMTLKGKNLTLTEKGKFYKRMYEPSDWNSFRDAVSVQNKFAGEPVIIRTN